MGIPLLAGRHFARTDGPGALPVVIVSESTAADLWPDGPAVGQRIRFADHPDWHTVVGVAGDVRYGGLDSDPRSPIYRPFLQNPGRNGIRLVLTARTTVDPQEIMPQIETAARGAYPAVLLREGSLMSSTVSESATDQRYRALLVVTFGLVAVLLAAVGIFGVVARAVAQRSHELAIRMALGANSGGLRWLMLTSTLTTGVIGVGGGLIAAGWGSRFIGGFLFEVQSSDPLTYWVVTLTVLSACSAAAYLPTRRLLLLQPARVMRAE
jgi:putative ABC transport system permease protein